MVSPGCHVLSVSSALISKNLLRIDSVLLKLKLKTAEHSETEQNQFSSFIQRKIKLGLI